MYLEIPSPEQAAEVAAWWRQAFQALEELITGAAERETPRPR